jgi:putative membrane fusion protein
MRRRKDLWDILGKAVATVLVVLLSLYIAIPVVRQVSGRYETEPVTYITVTESGNTSGVIVRAEKLLSTDMPYVSLLAENGEEVAANSAVAVAVQNQSSLDVAHRANEVETEINYLRGLLSRLSTASDSAEQETAMRTAVYRLAEASMQEDAGELDSAAATLSTLLRGGAAENSEEELGALLDELADLRASLGAKDYLYAPAAGIFSAETDGFEGLTPAVLDGITPEGVENLRTQSDTVPDDVVGKIVTNHAWYYAAVMAEKDADRLRVGDVTSLDFGYRSSRTVRAVVRSISPTDRAGQVAVVFRCSSALAETLSLRLAEAEVVFHTYSGLRVPKKAVHVEDDKTVVYTASAGQMERKSVDILYTGEDFYLVEAGSEGGSLRAGNELIVSGKNLKDGNVVN